MLTAEQARELIDKARASFKMTSDLITQIIHHEAWTPLGYASFTAMWAAEFNDLPLAAEVRAAVVYEMFKAGADALEVSAAVHGIGVATAESLRSQQENGVPAEVASLAPRRHRTVNQRRAYDRHIDLRVTESEYESIAAMAGEAGVTIDKWVMTLITAAWTANDADEAV